MTGHAESAPDTEGLADLASFLGDKSQDTADEDDQDIESDESNEEQKLDDTDEDEDDQSDESKDDESEEEDPKAAPASDRKIAVTVKGDDGEESTIEVGEQELVKGYQRQADYTRKTQELASRENEAVQFLRGKHHEVVNHYVERAEATRMAIVQMAGIRSEAEMAQLAQSDPQAWVAESQRQQSIGSYLSQLDQQIAGEKQRVAQEREQSMAQAKSQMFQRTWQELSKAKIGKPELSKIYGETSKSYGFTPKELGDVYDHRIVLMMRDATAYRTLQAQKAEVTRKVAAAPKLPSKQASSVTERKSVELNARFKGGRAKLNDLAAFLR